MVHAQTPGREEIKDVEIPATMQRAMARQGAAEFQAVEKLYEAAEITARNPGAL